MLVTHRLGAYEVMESTLRGALASVPACSFVLTDHNVRGHWGRHLEAFRVYSVEPGEGSKSLETYGGVLAWLAESGAGRRDILVAVGGGVVGDLGGFVAATYMRGIAYVQIPTTLLAQVDSSVGGKVAIDLPHGKNLVGAFYPPVAVYLCNEVLSTLPLREFRCGMAEVVKYGAIADRGLLEDLEERPLTPEDGRVPPTVRRCVELKAAVVEQDELETTGLRSTLNFGHTVGHAVESLTGYGPIAHGEAVSIGIVAETLLGERLGITEAGASARLRDVLERHGLPTALPKLETDALLQAMRSDKKASRGELAFALLTTVGHCKLVTGVPEEIVVGTLRELA